MRGKQIEHEQDRKETGKRQERETGKTGETGETDRKKTEEKRERDKQELYIFKFAFDVISI